MQFPDVSQRPQNNPFVRPRGDSRPMHKLPVELFSRIFEFGAVHGMTKAYDYYELLEKAAGESPLSKPFGTSWCPFQIVVSHVCRHWRHIAISTASVWTDIRVFTHFVHPPYNLVSLHLERSGCLPLDIAVNDYSEVTTPSDAQHLYALLIPHVPRWRSIEVKSLKSPNIFAFLAAVSNLSTPPAAQLESFRLTYLDEMDPPDYIPTPFNGSAPRLKHLLLYNIDVDWSDPWISAASNLISLELFKHIDAEARPSWIEFSTILRGAPRLQRLTLHYSGPFEHPDDWVLESTGASTDVDFNAPIPLLHLTELVLGSQPVNVATAFLHHFYMPALKTLILSLKYGDYSDFVSKLTGPATSLTSPSNEGPQCSLPMRLERLALLKLSCANRALMITMFSQLNNLKSLRLALRDEVDSDSDPPSRPLLLELLLPVGDVVYLPRLESLVVCASKGDLAFFRDLVEKRMDAGVPLKSLCISVDEYLNLQSMEWFRERLERCWFTSDMDRWDTSHTAFEGYW